MPAPQVVRYRDEYKHVISCHSKVILEKRLAAVLKMDEHSTTDGYLVRSVYFDTPHDHALWDKIDGVPHQEKFRIRCYNNDYGFLRLEKKVKDFNRGYKLGAPITREAVEAIIRGDLGCLQLSTARERLHNEFLIKCRTTLLRSKVVVEYRRKVFVFGPARTRVTLDYDMRSSAVAEDFFCPDMPHGTLEEDRCVLEVKFDGFLPEIVRDLVQVAETTSSANSKYVNARIASSPLTPRLRGTVDAWLDRNTEIARGD
ncbi:MAG: polyphosphate polymerase domain-containing protein [Bacillota bacterium]|nr:polyphosphate polymerase domain-containing protein [Bacillota bacterium]